MTGGGRGDLKEAKRREATFRIAQKAEFTRPVKLVGEEQSLIDFLALCFHNDLSLPTCVTFSCGMVSKLGEEKVNPLSVPASYGKRTSETFSFHWSPSQRLMLSTPTNQSGLGTILTINDSWSWVRRKWSIER